MHPIFTEHPILVRLLKSAQSALPVTRDPWHDLAYGIGLSREELTDKLLDLQERGILLGMMGETNIAHPLYRELIVLRNIPNPERERWISTGQTASLWKHYYELTDRKPDRIVKAGLLLPWPGEGEKINLLAPSSDRTPLVRDDDPAIKKSITRQQEKLFEMLARPIPVDPTRTPWEQIAELSASFTPEEVRQDLMQLILAKRFRRFAFRISPKAAGFQGCGMAYWKLDEADAPRAAQALAAVRGTGDVIIRSDNFMYNLTAVFLGDEPGSGKTAALDASQQWNRELGNWMDLEIE